MSVIEAVETKLSEAVETVKEAVVKVDNRVKIEIEVAEKYALTKSENDFLRAQNELQQLSTRISQVQEAANKARTSFMTQSEELAKKYEFDVTKFMFNTVEGVFGKVPEGPVTVQGK